jgi:hypothetical protein
MKMKERKEEEEEEVSITIVGLFLCAPMKPPRSQPCAAASPRGRASFSAAVEPRPCLSIRAQAQTTMEPAPTPSDRSLSAMLPDPMPKPNQQQLRARSLLPSPQSSRASKLTCAAPCCFLLRAAPSPLQPSRFLSLSLSLLAGRWKKREDEMKEER